MLYGGRRELSRAKMQPMLYQQWLSLKMKKILIIIVVLGIVLSLGWMIDEKRKLQVTPLPATSTTTTTIAPTTMANPILDFKEALLLAKTDPKKALQSCPQTERYLFCMLKVFCEASDNPDAREKACEAFDIKPEHCNVYLNACTDPKASLEECGNIFEGEEIEMCKSFVSELAAARGLTSESLDLCSKITIESMRFECMMTVAILDKNLEICDNIGTDLWVERWYWETAVAYGEPEICNHIKNQTDSENCLKQVQNQ
jgi:hypothetical protein